METLEGKTTVRIHTTHYNIIGQISHFSETRLTDYMNEAKEFIAVMDAEVRDKTGARVLNASFLNLSRNHIEMIMPAEMVELS